MTPGDSDPRGADRKPPDLGPVAERLARAERILITAHENGDGDSVGSTVALARALQALGREVRVVLADFPRKYAFLDPGGLVWVPDELPGADFFGRWDLGVLLDANQPARTGRLESGFFGGAFPVVCVDHHLGASDGVFAAACVHPPSAATGSLVLGLLRLFAVDLDRAMAEALFVAIATDTGWFQFSNTSAEVLADAAELAAAGADPECLYRRVYRQHTLARIHLEGEILRTAEVDLDGAMVWSKVDRPLIARAGVPRSQFEGLIDGLRAVDGHEVAVLFTEGEPDSWKLSLRSRDNVDVEAIASELGGGGHAKAAGARLAGDFVHVKARALEAIARGLSRVRELEGPQGAA